MSRKITAFRLANIAPKTACNYVVWIPSILTSPLSVEAASIPKIEITSSSFALNGQTYSLPVRKVMTGSWTCTMNENLFLTTLYQALYKQHSHTKAYDNIDNQILTAKLDDIYIFLTDEVAGLAPVGLCVLKNCYLESVSEIKLSAAAATEPIKIQLYFRYNGIEDCYQTVDNIVGIYETSNAVEGVPFAIGAAVGGVTLATWTALKAANATEDLGRLIKDKLT